MAAPDRKPIYSPGLMLVLSAPSGAGKTTLVRSLLERDPNFRFAVSHTTRAPRPGEVHGREYYFVDEATFRDMINRGAFLEWARVHAHYYGTSLAEVQRHLAGGHDLILEIDVQGAVQVQQRFPEAIFVMILPPSWSELRRRLEKRGDLAPPDLRLRLREARRELQQWWRYDYLVVNETVEETIETLTAIVWAHRHQRDHMRRVVEDLEVQLENDASFLPGSVD